MSGEQGCGCAFKHAGPCAHPAAVFRGWLPRDPVESAAFFGVDRTLNSSRLTAAPRRETWRARVATALRRLARWVER